MMLGSTVLVQIRRGFNMAKRCTPHQRNFGACFAALHRAAEPAVRSAVKILVSQRNDTIKAFSSRLIKIKTVHKFLWPLLVVNLSIPGLI